MAKKLKQYRSRLLEKLTIPSEAAHYVNAALEDSTEMFLEAVKDVAQAHQMATVAKKSGVARENLYRAFSVEGNPTLDTLQSVLPALGLKIIITFIPDGSTQNILPASTIKVIETAKQPALFYRELPLVSPIVYPVNKEGKQHMWTQADPMVQEKRAYVH